MSSGQLTSGSEGGGGGGSAGDGSSTGGSTSGSSGDDVTLVSFSRSELRKLAIILNNPRVWIVSALTGFSIEATAQLLTQKSPVAILIDDYLYRTVLLPLAIDLFNAGTSLVDSSIIIAFGTDRRVGVVLPGHQAGIADVPLVLLAPVIRSLVTVGQSIYLAINGVNQSIAQGLGLLGIAAPTFVAFIWALELTLIGYVIYVILSFIPGVNIPGILRALTSPASRLFRRFL